MENLPLYISLVFILTTVLTIFFLYKASGSKLLIGIIAAWLVIQMFVGLSGFYRVMNTTPPRFMLLIIPPILAIAVLFFTSKGRKFLNGLNPEWMTLLNVVRMPVEIILFLLFMYKQIPELMTFEGRNYDILSGLTAPVIAYFGYHKNKLGKPAIVIWNLICLGLLFNIVINAILSAPFKFQQFAFDQPNVALLYFPFIWLPAFIVPAVLFSHLVCIRQLLKRKRAANTALEIGVL